VGVMLLTTSLVALPFVVLALITRIMASYWLSYALVLLAAAGAVWISREGYPASRGDAQGALVFVFLPIYLCMGAGVVAVLVLLSESMARARVRLALAKKQGNQPKTVRERWIMAVSAALFVLAAGACALAITRWAVRHHEVNAALNLTSQEARQETLERALAAKDYEILGILAHQDLPGKDLRRIHDACRQNRNAGSSAFDGLASNPGTPPELLVSLAGQGTYQARGVARNPSTPFATLEQLATHEDKWVRRAVAQNPSAPLSLLAVLAEDGEEMVKDTAKHFLNKSKGKAGKKKAAAKANQP